ncbi:MAG: conjugal transfer protein TraX [Oscillospiraceae bacterium]|nr:conjugal transfer protein TraX [Oscillospiraceae bacterium]
MSSFKLKLVALLAMTIDHAAKILGQLTFLLIFPNALSTTANIILSMEVVGRIAFPLFAFMVAEGCCKARSVPKYMLRLAIFAVISQPIYHLAFSTSPRLLDWQLVKESFASLSNPDNIFVTLLLGALPVFTFKRLKCIKNSWAIFIALPVLAACSFIAAYLHTSYGAWGVLLIFVLYLFHRRRQSAVIILLWSTVFYLGYASWNGSRLGWLNPDFGVSLHYIMHWAVSCFSTVFVLLYNGERGEYSRWFFYIYYPSHLFMLFTAKCLIL